MSHRSPSRRLLPAALSTVASSSLALFVIAGCSTSVAGVEPGAASPEAAAEYCANHCPKDRLNKCNDSLAPFSGAYVKALDDCAFDSACIDGRAEKSARGEVGKASVAKYCGACTGAANALAGTPEECAATFFAAGAPGEQLAPLSDVSIDRIVALCFEKYGSNIGMFCQAAFKFCVATEAPIPTDALSCTL